MPASGALSHSSPSAVWPFSTGKAESPTTAISGREHDDEPDRGEEAARQRPARLARLLGEVGDRLEARVGEHRERQREGEVVPGRRHAEDGPLRERVRREEQCEPEDHEQELRREVEPGDDESRRVELRAASEPDAGDRERSRRRRSTMSHGDSRSSSDRRAPSRGSAAGTASRARSRSGSRGRAPSR